MNTRTLLNLGLVVLVAALALVAWFRPGKHEKPVIHIVAMKPADIHTLKVLRQGQPDLVLEKKDGSWQITQPLTVPADGNLVDSILSSVDEESEDRYPVKDLDLSRYGLQPPKLTLWLNDRKLEFGDTEPLQNRRYIRIGDTVHLVNDLLYYRLAATPVGFADKSLLPGAGEVQSVTVPGLKISKDQGGHWTLDPADPSITTDTIQKLADAWRHARAIQVSRYDGGGDVQGKAIIEIEGVPQPIEFRILTSNEGFRLARADLGITYELVDGEQSQLMELQPPPAKGAHTRPQQAGKPEATPSDDAHAGAA